MNQEQIRDAGQPLQSDDDRHARVFAGHDRQRPVEFGVAEREVRDIVRGLARAARPAGFAKVDGVKAMPRSAKKSASAVWKK